MNSNCLDCGAEYGSTGLDLVLPDQQWMVIFSEASGILCPTCICKRAATLGGTAVVAWIINMDYSKVIEEVEYKQACDNCD